MCLFVCSAVFLLGWPFLFLMYFCLDQLFLPVVALLAYFAYFVWFWFVLLVQIYKVYTLFISFNVNWVVLVFALFCWFFCQRLICFVSGSVPFLLFLWFSVHPGCPQVGGSAPVLILTANSDLVLVLQPISTGYVSAALCLCHASGAATFHFSLCVNPHQVRCAAYLLHPSSGSPEPSGTDTQDFYIWHDAAIQLNLAPSRQEVKR